MAQVARLITQLGSSHFKEREAAVQALDAIGPSALEALRKATLDKDPEVRRRAEALAQKIYRRVQTAQLLEPKRVWLVYKDVPVKEAVEDFAQKTGFPIKLTGARRAWDRKLTLDTGETTFWEAYEQFCQKAGLSDRVAVPMPAPEQEIRVWNAKGAPMRAQVLVHRYREQMAGNTLGALTLVDGKPESLPTCRTGAVRFRALPANGTMWAQGDRDVRVWEATTGRANGTMPAQGSGDTFFVLEVTPEPKLAWQSIVDLHIDKAVDEHGQSLTPVLAMGNEAGSIAAGLQGNNVIIIDGETGQPVSDWRDVPVRFKAPAKSSRVLKEVSGTVTAQVQTPVQALMTVDNIFKAIGQTIKGPDGLALKVLEAVHQPNGYVRLKLEFSDPAGGMVAGGGVVRRVIIMRGGNAIVRNRVVFRGGLGRMQEIGSANDASWALFDSQGQRLQLAVGPEMIPNANGDEAVLQLTYRPREGQAEAARLVYSARRNAVIEVPFTLKDVPVTKPGAADQTRPTAGDIFLPKKRPAVPPPPPPPPP